MTVEQQEEIRVLKKKIHQYIQQNKPEQARLGIIRLKYLLKMKN